MFQDSSTSALAKLRAVKLLGDIGDSGAAESMKRTLFTGTEENAAVRREIIRSLSKIGRDDIILDYLKSNKEDSPIVLAAIALTLRDENSKDALGHLLAASDNARVFAAASPAIRNIYKPTLDSFESTSPVDTHRPRSTQLPPPRTFGAAETARPKLERTSGDRAIFSALRAKQTDKDPEISKTAAALLAQLSDAYKTD
jgi:hypothetical protein